MIEKRAANEKKHHTTTAAPNSASTTGSPSTTKKPKGAKKHNSSTSTSKPDDAAEAASPSTTAGPKDLSGDMEVEAERERLYWKEQEDLALSYVIAGVDSWARAYTRMGRTFSETKLGEALFKIEMKFRRILSPPLISKLIQNYRDLKGNNAGRLMHAPEQSEPEAGE